MFGRRIIQRTIYTIKQKREFENTPNLRLSKDETCFISYHGKKEHPYEYTLPVEKKSPDQSMFKVTTGSEDMFQKWPNLEQVQMLTYTPRSVWKNSQGKERKRKFKQSFDILTKQ